MEPKDAQRLLRRLGMTYALEPLLEGDYGRLEAALDSTLEEARGRGHRIRERNHTQWRELDRRNRIFYAAYSGTQLCTPQKFDHIIDSFRQYYGVKAQSGTMREIAARQGRGLPTVQREIHFAQLWLKNNKTAELYHKLLDYAEE